MKPPLVKENTTTSEVDEAQARLSVGLKIQNVSNKFSGFGIHHTDKELKQDY